MFEEGLVSIISPCYNVSGYLPYFFESLLTQSYRKLEIILVNDGSTDDTAEVIRDWLPRLEAAGFSTIYIAKSNGGQSSALNEALPYFGGEFLTWVDPDDVLYPESVAVRVDFLKANQWAGFVRSECDVYNEDDRGKIVDVIKRKGKAGSAEIVFRDLIFERTYITSLCYMVRSSAFISANPDRKIYVCKEAGQNFQMLLPISSKFQCGYVPKSLCGYIIRGNSHSHSNNSAASKIRYFDTNLKVLKETLRENGLLDCALANEIDIFYSDKRLGIYFSSHDFDLVNEELRHHRQVAGTSFRVLAMLCRQAPTFYGIVLPAWHIKGVTARILSYNRRFSVRIMRKYLSFSKRTNG